MKLKYIITNAILSLSLASVSLAQDQPDPFVKGGKGKQIEAEKATTTNPTHHIILEAFSLTFQDAAALVRDDKGHQQTYDYLVENGKQEVLVLTSGISGEKSTNEAVHEFIYPTEWKPAELPDTLGVQVIPQPRVDKNGNTEPNKNVPDIDRLNKAATIQELSKLSTSATGAEFETRNVGITFETQCTVIKKNDVDVQIAVEFTEYIGDHLIGEGVSKTPMPNFESQRISTGFKTTLGKPYIIGTINRPPSSKLDGEEKRVWFATLAIRPSKQ